jgi:hypothetical protein
MNQLYSVKSNTKHKLNGAHSKQAEFQAARTLVKHNRTQGFAALNELFRTGVVPAPSGRYAGELIAIDIAPGLTQLFQTLFSVWMPWLGKTFDPAQRSGDNIFTQDSYLLARLFNPFYLSFVDDKPGSYRGFAFRTYVAPGLVDDDRSVLKIDYDLKENPALTVRRVLDELVQISDNLYLGKAHVRWWWRSRNDWQTVAYFSLTQGG